MTTPTATEPKKSNALKYILIGCGGCFLLSGIAVVGLTIVGGYLAREAGTKLESSIVELQVLAQQADLSSHLAGDTDRLARAETIYEELQKMAEAGELESSEVDDVQKELTRATSDGKLEPAEADKVLEMAEALTK